MGRCDTLIQYLAGRNSGANSPSPTMEAIYDKGLTNPPHKIPKVDKEVIEELKMHNESLQDYVLQLLQEVDFQKSENDRLRKENADIKKQIENLRNLSLDDSCEEREGYPILDIDVDNLATMQLPPLEMPKFDYTPFKLNADGSE